MQVKVTAETVGFGRRALAMVLVSFLTFSMALASITIAQLHDHDCSGDGCETCLVLTMAQAALVATAILSACTSAAAAAMLAVGAFALLRPFGFAAETLVTQRVRLLI